MNLEYKDKYLKYKSKYINLKKQIGKGVLPIETNCENVYKACTKKDYENRTQNDKTRTEI